MADYAVAVARELGWEQKRLDLLLHAAPMHDIGKIAVPDSILKKPGPLDPDEWEIVKRHPLTGARILSGSSSDVLRLAEVVALTHHEKWNGSGYPHGIAGEAIPLVGRVVAICDVFDALTERRPYKQPFALPTAMSIIGAGAGAHFDPEVVAAFFRAEQAILAIRARYSSDERRGHEEASARATI
jgi:putative two-component system response regulator